MRGQYILDENGNPVEATSLEEWARFFDNRDARRLAYTKVSDDVNVSTVFLGIDHAFGGGPPVLWETMIFGGPHDEYQDRYTTREDALRGHEEAVALARSGLA